jgi:hypothetical protein
MSEDIYRNEDKGFIVTRYCGKNGVAMYQITMHEDFVQLTEEELNKMMTSIIQYQMKNFKHPRIRSNLVKNK